MLHSLTDLPTSIFKISQFNKVYNRASLQKANMFSVLLINLETVEALYSLFIANLAQMNVGRIANAEICSL